MALNTLFLCSLIPLASLASAAKVVRRESYWTGDQRGGDTDSYAYDISYDEQGPCPNEVRTPSIRGYILMGSILHQSRASSSHECAMQCLEFTGCSSANYYFAAKAMTGQCELLLEKQEDNPDWMLRLDGATYLEVYCQDSETEPKELPKYEKPAKKGNFLKDLIRKLKSISVARS